MYYSGQKLSSIVSCDNLSLPLPLPLTRYLIDGEKDAINPKKKGTKVAAHYPLEVEGGKEVVVRMRLTNKAFDAKTSPFGKGFDTIFADRIQEADEFYDGLSKTLGPQQSLISRQAYAGKKPAVNLNSHYKHVHLSILINGSVHFRGGFHLSGCVV